MRLACVSDVHANPFGLKACLGHAGEQGVDGYLVAGDLVGKGPLPGPALDRVADLDAPTVQGNVDRSVLAAEPVPDGGTAAWTAARLSEQQRDYLDGLPREIELTVEGLDILLLHGSPLADDDYVFPTITEPALERKLDGRDVDVLVCGHSHLPFHERLGNAHVVNAGTAGLPYDGDPRPSYVLVDIEDGSLEATVHRVGYDVPRIATAVEEQNSPGATPSAYRAGTMDGTGDPGPSLRG